MSGAMSKARPGRLDSYERRRTRPERTLAKISHQRRGLSGLESPSCRRRRGDAEWQPGEHWQVQDLRRNDEGGLSRVQRPGNANLRNLQRQEIYSTRLDALRQSVAKSPTRLDPAQRWPNSSG